MKREKEEKIKLEYFLRVRTLRSNMSRNIRCLSKNTANLKKAGNTPV